ncbi:phage neck terminator protein [Paenibacillus melissococcoides]|uniref:phage neck terminator protein n=1 Tax=Paenibacillus melissococcoides TaxID=2912268 RepID=UPI0036F1F96F
MQDQAVPQPPYPFIGFTFVAPYVDQSPYGVHSIREDRHRIEKLARVTISITCYAKSSQTVTGYQDRLGLVSGYRAQPAKGCRQLSSSSWKQRQRVTRCLTYDYEAQDRLRCASANGGCNRI